MIEWLTEWSGWIGTTLAVIGIWMLGKKHRSGFLICGLSCVLWGLKGVLTYQIDLITVEALILITELHAWMSWGKDGHLADYPGTISK